MTTSKGLWRSLRIAALALVGAVALGAMTPEPSFAQETSAAVETITADEGTGDRRQGRVPLGVPVGGPLTRGAGRA